MEQTQTQTVPPTVLPAVLPAVGMEYVSRIIATLGVQSQLTQHASRISEIAAMTSKGAANEALMSLLAEKEPPAVNPAIKRVVEETIREEAEERRREAERVVESYLARANEQLDEANYLLGKAAEARRKEGDATNKLAHLAEEVATICKSWYTLDEARSAADAYKTLHFITDKVYIRHVNASAGINTTLNMGQYRIAYTPMDASIKVFAHKYNRVSRGYVHPHVSINNDPCWGDGTSTMMQSLTAFKPSAAFGVLRSLLQTYNDGSPYASLVRFAECIDPEQLDTHPTEYRIRSSSYVGTTTVVPTGWIWRTDIPKNVERGTITRKRTRPYTSDGPTTMSQYAIPVYAKYYKDRAEQPINEVGRLYVRGKDGLYYEVPVHNVQNMSVSMDSLGSVETVTIADNHYLREVQHGEEGQASES